MLLEQQLKIRAESEQAAMEIITSYRDQAVEKGYTIKKADYTYKKKTSKGELLAEVWLVTIILVFADIWEGLI